MFRRGLVVLVLAVSLAGCEDPEAKNLERRNRLDVQTQKLSSILGNATARVSAGDEGLTIQLTFGADADLDLYVTDPLLETVYFANHSGKSGGRISDDVRCDGLQERGSRQTPRIEEVRFDAPIPGLYRIGIDYPTKCEGGEEQAAIFNNGFPKRAIKSSIGVPAGMSAISLSISMSLSNSGSICFAGKSSVGSA